VLFRSVLKIYILIRRGKAVMTTCPKCGSSIPNTDARFCPLCAYPLFDAGQNDAGTTPEKVVPWESIQSLGVGPALLCTLRECLLEPYSFFSKVAASRSAGMAFVYALILGSIGSVLGFVWTYFFLDSGLFSSLSWLDKLTGGKQYSASVLILMPFIITVKELFLTLYFHTLIFFSRARRREIKFTFMAVCYAESTSILNLIPVAGSLLSPVLSLFILAAAFSKIHRMSTLKAVTIILLPLVVLVFLFIIALAGAIGAGVFVNGFLNKF
jgi:hypothetical protein